MLDSGTRVAVITTLVSSGGGFAGTGAVSGASASMRVLPAIRMAVNSEA
jgi:hypothetical protein